MSTYLQQLTADGQQRQADARNRRRRMRPRYLRPGTISEGTLRPEDLIPNLLWELQRIKLSRADRLKVRKRSAEFDHRSDDGAVAYAQLGDIWDDLCNVADQYVPDYCHFGSHEGDGARVGVWVDIESAQLAVQEGDLWAEATREPYQEGSRSDVTEHGYAKFHGPHAIPSTFRTSVPRGDLYLVISDHASAPGPDEPVTLGLYDPEGFSTGSIYCPDYRAALIAVAAAEGTACDILERLLSCIETSDDPAWSDLDGHGPLVRELRALLGGGQ